MQAEALENTGKLSCCVRCNIYLLHVFCGFSRSNSKSHISGMGGWLTWNEKDVSL